MSLRVGVWFFPAAPSAAIVEAIVAAEQLGLDEVWLGDEGPARDPFALLAAAARATHRIRLGVGVTNPYLRHPAATAATAMTIHELSDGRMVLGLGPGGDLALAPARIQRVRPLSATRDALRIIRAVCGGYPTDGYTPMNHALRAADLPVFIGARGERFNRFASAEADGVFLGGIPRSRLTGTAGWARSIRQIELAVYPAAVFDADAREALRPRLIHALLDAPAITREALGVCRGATADAAAALAQGVPGPARAIIDDRVLDELLAYGTPEQVGRELAARVRSIRPRSLGIAMVAEDPMAMLEPAAEALAVARKELE
jgi:5,10-methylenetetrahydromethanopterin reductase